MQPAPAVSFECEDGGAWRAVQALLIAVAAAAMVRWLAGWAGLLAWPGALVASIAGLGVIFVVWRRERTPAPRLTWDGHRWQLRSGALPAVPGRVQVAMELGSWMLLTFRPEAHGRTRWLGVGSAAGSSARSALHAGGGAGPEGAAPPRAG